MYYLVYGLFYLMSLLPMWALYLLSDGIYLLLYYLIGYRRKVVADNLAIAFPSKTAAERDRIAKSFYHNFVDNFIETLKMLSASNRFIKARFVINNPEVFEPVWQQGRKCQIHLGHNFNWEMAALAPPLQIPFVFLVVYMPVANRLFERLMKKLRTRTGTFMLPATDMRKSLLPFRDKQYMLALVADQAPGDPAAAYWLNFFGRPTPIVRGPERGAAAGNIPAVFAEIYKIKRGFYRVNVEMGSDNPAALPQGELTRRYVAFLEKSISAHPSMWLWSHRRWKHEWKPEFRDQWIGDSPCP